MHNSIKDDLAVNQFPGHILQIIELSDMITSSLINNLRIEPNIDNNNAQVSSRKFVLFCIISKRSGLILLEESTNVK